jgi:hypothetical protein
VLKRHLVAMSMQAGACTSSSTASTQLNTCSNLLAHQCIKPLPAVISA